MAEEKAKLPLVQIQLWPRSRKLMLLAVVLLCAGVFGAIIFSARDADYRLLYANLASEDGAEVVRWLKDQKIPYRLEGDGASIYIPADQVYDTRLQLAGAGLPRGGGVGFEIFDKQSFGMTDFSQKINYLRALQGELSRTIGSLAPVESARVHLAIPEKRAFQSEQQPATASVILKLIPGMKLKEGQIQGIVHLVAGSVGGLDPDQVTVVDSTGKILTQPPQETLAGGASSGVLEYQGNLERQLEARAQSLLDRALGAGNSVVRVTANVDFSQQEQTEERYDPDASVVKSEQSSSDKNSGQSAGGVPGVAANLNGASQSGTTSGSSHSQESINYELSKVVSHKVFPVGTIKNLSVAVLVADRIVPGAKGQEPTYVPRKAEELQTIESMVRSALGVSNQRGDQFEIRSLPFENDFGTEPVAAAPTSPHIYDYVPYIKYGLIALAALFAYLLLLRPVLRTLRDSSRIVTPMKTVKEMENELLTDQGVAKALPNASHDLVQGLRDQAIQQKAPYAQIIKAWMREG